MAQMRARQVHTPLCHAPRHIVTSLNSFSFAKSLRTTVSAPRHADIDVPTIYGIVLNDPYDYYIGSFKAEAGTSVERVFANEHLDASGAAVYALGRLYVNCLEEWGFEVGTTQYVFDTDTWTLLEERDDLYQSSSAACMGYDATTDRIYGIYYDDSGTSYMGFGYTTATNPDPSYIRFYEEDETPMVMAVASDGTIYAIDVNGRFLTIDKDNGELNYIGHTDVKPAYMQDAVIDPATGRFYWAAFTKDERGALYEVNTTTGEATLISYFPNNEEFVGLYIPDAAASDSSPADITDLAFHFEGPSLTGQVSYTLPAVTIGGNTISGHLTAHLVIDGETYQMEGQPGQSCYFDVTVKNAGEHTAMAYVTGEGGQSNKTKLTQWLGYDYPCAVANLTLVKDDNNAVLTWSPPTIGKHGGYVSPEACTYIVSRTGLWMDDYQDTIFTEDMTGKIGTYSYFVRAVQQELAGEVAYSNEVYFGPDDNTWGVPGEVQFVSDYEFCTVIDANNDGYGWAQTWGGYVVCNSPRTGKADDWIITPKFNLQTGQMYRITYDASAKLGPLNPEVMEVCMGSEPTVAAMTQLIATEEYTDIFSNTGFDTREHYITVEQDGDYCFGFHAISTDGNALNLSEFTIKVSAEVEAPAAVDSLTLVAGADGLLSATISFVAPTLDLAGNKLSAIGRIDILREGEVIHTIENPTPGDSYSFTDDNARQGDNTYRVIPYATTGENGLEAEATVYCGVEIPDLPGNVVLTLDNDLATLTWEPPTQGINGGYINPEDVVYTIYETTYGETIADSITGTSFTIALHIYENRQYGFNLAIGTRNIAGTNEDVIVSNAVVVGNPYLLPIKESFNRGMPAYSWFLVGETIDDDGWQMLEHSGENTGYARFYGTALWGGEEQSMILGKLSLRGAANPILRLQVACANHVGDKLLIQVSSSIYGPYEVLKTITFDNAALEDWTPIEIPLGNYIDQDYIHVSFHGVPAAEDCNIYIDDIEIRDVFDHDISVSDFSVSDHLVEVGKTTVKVQTTIENRGASPLAQGDYTIRLHAGDRIIGTYQGVALEPYQCWDISCDYVPMSSDPSPVAIYAEAVYEADQDLSNNKSETFDVNVIKPELPAVTTLTGIDQQGNTLLTWTQPDLSGTPVQVLTDSFEDYIAFDINRAGDWTFYDADGLPTYTDFYFPGRNQPMAYIVMNPGQVQRLSGTLADNWPAHSGQQYMATFCTVGGDNDDWMVSPPLSGNAQTVTFYAKSGSEKQGHEMVEVYYSTSDNAIASMVKTGDDVYKIPAGEWTMYAVEVPEGARYFAIRCISHDRYALMIDDVTFERAAQPLEVSLVGYHVYCNGQPVTTEPVTATSYLIQGVDPEAVYYVTAVYDLGESQPSGTISVIATGISETNTTQWHDADIFDLQGRKVTLPMPGQVYVVKGRKIILKQR